MNPFPRPRAALIALLVASGFSGPGGATAAPEDAFAPPQVVDVLAYVQSPHARPGEVIRAVLELDIDESWHVNSDQPLEEFLIPTEVFFDDTSLAVGKIIFPPAEVRKLAISDADMALFEGRAAIGIELQLPPDLPHGQLEVRGVVSYQACDDEKCLAPEEEPFALTLEVGDTAAAPPTHPVFQKVDWDEAQTPGATGGDFGDKSLALIFLATFMGGLALNLTPCVYPMIPITISVFGSQGGGPRRSLVLAIFYVLGMAITYSVLGTFAAMTGNLLGSALQNPLVLAFVAAVMVALALSMFGVYDIQMPQALNRMAGETRQGALGSLLMGLTVGIVAAPCIGPFVLALLTYVGASGNPFLGFSLFFVLALGLGIPFLILAVVSGSVASLPSSGGWMVWVKKLFGFILLGMALYFLTRSERLIPERWLMPGLALLALIGGVYLGWIDKSTSFGGGFQRIKRAVGVAGIAAALALMVVPRLAPERPGIPWTPYAETHLQSARQGAQPVIVDFSAAWCIPCKELDHLTFADGAVVDKSERFVTLKADLTESSSPAVKTLKERFNVRGVPTVIFLHPDGTEMEDLRIVSVIKPDEFLAKMESALSRLSGA